MLDNVYCMFKQTENRSDGKLASKNTLVTFGIIFLVTLLVTTTAGSLIYNQYFSDTDEFYGVSYEITTIPYVGIFNNQGPLRQSFSRTANGAILISVLEYWFPNANDIEVIDGVFATANESSDFGIIEAYLEIEDVRFESQTDFLRTDQIGKYLNDERSIPLITNLPVMVPAEGESTYEPLTLVVGLDTEANTIVVQNYWLGRHTLTLEEYRTLQESSFSPHEFLVVTPTTIDPLVTSVTNFSDQYPILTNDNRSMFANYAKADALKRSSEPATAIPYYQEAYASDSFTTFMPPAMRVNMLSRYAQTLFQLGRFEDAQPVIEEALRLNNNLAEPFSIFASYDYLLNNNAPGYRDQLSLPHIIAGDIYRLLGLSAAAIEQYETALDIFPGHVGPRVMLERLAEENSQ